MRDKLARKTAELLEGNMDDEDIKWLSEWKKKIDIIRRKPIKETSREEFREYFEIAYSVLYGDSSKIMIILLVAWLLGLFTPVKTILITFAIIRIFANGFHMDSYLKCLISSLLIFIFGAYISTYINSIINSIQLLYVFLIISYILSIILAFLYAPKDTPTKRITNIKIIKLKKRATIIILTLISLKLSISYINNSLIFISSCIGMLLEMITLTPIAVKVSEKFYSKKEMRCESK